MIRQEIKKLIESSIKELQKEDVFPKFNISQFNIEHPEEENHGDYATNVAMVIVKEAKKNPLEIAKLINWKKEKGYWIKLRLLSPALLIFFFLENILSVK